MAVPTQVTPDETAGDLSSRGNGQAAAAHTGTSSAPASSSADASERIRMRRTVDLLVGAAGLVMVGVLVVAGSLLTWGHFYIGNEVHNQLAAQKIVFPAANSPAVAAPEFQAMRQYG